jgi:hypothetical protein
MNKDLLSKNESIVGFRVFEPKDLLENFLDTVRSEVQEATRTRQPLLLLVFAHRKAKTSRLFIGCDKACGNLILKQKRLASVLQREVQTTMISTSSCSGG